MSAIAIIPARGGSRRIPNKNRRMFHGKPIIAYSIEAAWASGLFDQVIVSTDDIDIATIAANLAEDGGYDISVHKRSAKMAEDSVGTQEVMRGALLAQAKYKLPDYACCIYPTAPLLLPIDLYRGFQLLKSRNAAFAFSVGTDPLQDAGAFYCGTTLAFIDSVPLVGPTSVMVPLPSERVCDINTEEDWLRAEKMYLALRGNNGN